MRFVEARAVSFKRQPMLGSVAKPAIRVAASLAALACLQWGTAQAYATWCAPPGLSGLVTSLFTTGSPVCSGLGAVQLHLTHHFATLCVVVVGVAGSLFQSKL